MMHWYALLLAAVLVVAMVGHELTHAAAALVVAESTRVDVRAMETICEYRDGAHWQPYAVAVAPLAVGLVAGLTALATVGLPTSPTELVVAVGWVAYTFGGGVDEYRFPARGKNITRHRENA